jgi:transposase
MSNHARKAVVAQNGRCITVLGAGGKKWKLRPASFCAWAAKSSNRRKIIGFGDTVWKAIQDGEKIIKGERK